MSNRLNDLIEAIRIAFCKLEEIQFDAPWSPRKGRC